MQLELQLTSALDLKEKDERIYMYIRKSNSLENTGITCITEKKRPSAQENILIKKGEYDRGTPFSRISNTWPPNDKKSA